ncbi:hypothetical protein C808_01418 [Lachnospiraceae bacterium M18-1]|nr:hypothetical protein C808_01418 [Lachnospiraceae bacterium M18-1]
MRSSLKKRIIILLVIIFGGLSITRIMYINSRQHVRKVHTYKAGETFEYDHFQIKAADVNIYSADNMRDMYKEIPKEVLAENEIVIKLEVKNIADEERMFHIAPFTLQVGIENGGAIDPYVYPYLNPGLSGKISFEEEETQAVMLVYPIERAALEAKEQIKLILSLYPEKYEIRL